MVGLPVMAALILAAVPVHDVTPEPLARPRPARYAAVSAASPSVTPTPAVVWVRAVPRRATVPRVGGPLPAAVVPAASVALPAASPPGAVGPLRPPTLTAPRARFVGFPLVVVRTAAPSRAGTVLAVALSPEASTQAP